MSHTQALCLRGRLQCTHQGTSQQLYSRFTPNSTSAFQIGQTSQSCLCLPQFTSYTKFHSLGHFLPKIHNHAQNTYYIESSHSIIPQMLIIHAIYQWLILFTLASLGKSQHIPKFIIQATPLPLSTIQVKTSNSQCQLLKFLGAHFKYVTLHSQAFTCL